MDYKEAYYKLLTTVLDDEKASVSTFENVQQIHESIKDNEREAEPNKITADQWYKMTYQQRVELKKNEPEAYESALKSDFKEVEA